MAGITALTIPSKKDGWTSPRLVAFEKNIALPSGKPPISTRSPTPTLVESPQVTGGTSYGASLLSVAGQIRMPASIPGPPSSNRWS